MAAPEVTVMFTTVLMLSLTYVDSEDELLLADGAKTPGAISTSGREPPLHIPISGQSR